MVYSEPKAQVSFFDEIIGNSNNWESDLDVDGT